ncbi:MAG TPA: hypothetical protein VF974_01655 [Patescibacteria group bacterium]
MTAKIESYVSYKAGQPQMLMLTSLISSFIAHGSLVEDQRCLRNGGNGSKVVQEIGAKM